MVLSIFGGVASAHTRSFETSLSIDRSPDGAVARRTVVRFSGELSSGKKACINDSRIRLIQIGEGVVGSDRTNGQGRYVIRERVEETARFRVRYSGEVLNSTHPHNHTCEASSSSRIRVRVG
ncbi:MAG: hypothetical protein ACRDGW_09000 [Actinomycetota bacterium]